MFEELREIYNFFEDEESKIIFQSRLLYGLTGEWKYIRDMLLFYRKKDKGKRTEGRGYGSVSKCRKEEDPKSQNYFCYL